MATEKDEQGTPISPLTLRDLITQSYMAARGNGWMSRWTSGEPGSNNKHIVKVEEVLTHKKGYPREAVEADKAHTFRIKVITVDLTTKERSNYQTTIVLDKLSLDSPVKVRCGSKAKYNKNMDYKQLKTRGICGDFYFKYMKVHSDAGTLFEINSTNNAAPVIQNPNQEIGMCKHLISAIKLLVATNFFYRIDDFKSELANERFIKQF